jgi:hypothetical protein
MSTYTDDVSGVIIGGDHDAHYKFYARHTQFDFVSYLADGLFASDAEAEAWVAERYPAEYAIGIEMRVRPA